MENPTYNYFKRIGAIVFLIEEIIKNKESAFSPLSNEQILINREIIVKTRCKLVVEGCINKIKELY